MPGSERGASPEQSRKIWLMKLATAGLAGAGALGSAEAMRGQSVTADQIQEKTGIVEKYRSEGKSFEALQKELAGKGIYLKIGVDKDEICFDLSHSGGGRDRAVITPEDPITKEEPFKTTEKDLAGAAVADYVRSHNLPDAVSLTEVRIVRGNPLATNKNGELTGGGLLTPPVYYGYQRQPSSPQETGAVIGVRDIFVRDNKGKIVENPTQEQTNAAKVADMQAQLDKIVTETSKIYGANNK